jgi:hypothetical protein
LSGAAAGLVVEAAAARPMGEFSFMGRSES